MRARCPIYQDEVKQATVTLYLPDGSQYDPICDSRARIEEARREQVRVAMAPFPIRDNVAAMPVEIVCDPENVERLMFLRWESESAIVSRSIECDGRIFVPPDPTSRYFPQLSLPTGLAPCGEPAELVADIISTFSRFVKCDQKQLLIAASFAVATWFPECFEAVPYLWVVGPFGSGKTKFLKLLWCMCRRGLIAGDLRSAALYQLTDAWHPTLIIDELERGRSGAATELLRMLRIGSVPGLRAFRNGQSFDTYGPKVIASRQPLDDAALRSRGPIVHLLPAEDETLPLDEAARQGIANEFQARLLMFRLTNYSAVRNRYMQSVSFQGLSARAKQIARALTAPLLGHPELSTQLLAVLRDSDDDVRAERALEAEWLVAEALFDLCHKALGGGRVISEILVGGVAARVNERLKFLGEDIRLSPKKTGLVLQSLGLRISRLGRMGRGLKVTTPLRRRVHHIARQLGIDRGTIATLPGLESGYGGVPCTLCEEFDLTGGLKFVDLDGFSRGGLRPSPSRSRMLDHPPDACNTQHVTELDELD